MRIRSPHHFPVHRLSPQPVTPQAGPWKVGSRPGKSGWGGGRGGKAETWGSPPWGAGGREGVAWAARGQARRRGDAGRGW